MYPTCADGSFVVLRDLLERSTQLDVSFDEIDSQLEVLHQRLVLEKAWTGYRADSSRFESLKTLQKLVKARRFPDALNLLVVMQRELRQFDIAETLYLISKAEQAANEVEGKNIILLLGNTGSGKSTTTHFLCASKLQVVREEGTSYIKPIEVRPELAESLKNVKVGKEMHSETRYITAITIDDPALLFEEYWPSDDQKSVVICDAPGFKDTSGPEVDMANAAGLVKAAQKARSVRPVLFIGSDSGGRFEGLRDLLHTLARVVPKISDHLESFCYVFTKFDDTDGPHSRKNIIGKIRSVACKPNDKEKSDPAFVSFINDMGKKAQRHLFTLNPLQDNPGAVLMNIRSFPAIAHPDKVFAFSACQESISMLQIQLNLHYDCIVDSCKRSDVDLIAHKLAELDGLNKALQISETKEQFETCKNLLVEHLKREYENAVKRLQRSLKDASDLPDEDVDHFLASWSRSKEFDRVLAKFEIGKLQGYVGPSSFEDNLNVQTKNLTSSILNVMEPLANNIIDSEGIVGIRTYAARMLKLRLLSQKIDLEMLSQNYKQSTIDLARKLSNRIEFINGALQADKFDQVGAALDELRNAKSFGIQQHLDQEECSIQSTYDQCVVMLTAHLRSLPTDSLEFLKRCKESSTVEGEGIECLKKCLTLLTGALMSPVLQNHLPDDFISELLSNLECEIVNMLETLILQSKDLLDKHKGSSYAVENCFVTMETQVSHMRTLRTLPGVFDKTTDQFHNFFEQIVHCLLHMKEVVEKTMLMVSYVESDGVRTRQVGNRPDISKLPGIISSMKQAKWMEQYRLGVYTDAVTSIEVAILQHAQQLLSGVQQFGIESCDEMRSAAQILEEFEYLGKMEGTISGLDQIHNQVKEIIKSSLNTVRERVVALFPLRVQQGLPVSQESQQISELGKRKLTESGQLVPVEPESTLGQKRKAENDAGAGEGLGEVAASGRLMSSSAANFPDLTQFDPVEADQALCFILACKEVRSNHIKSNINFTHRVFKKGVQLHIQMIHEDIEKHYNAIAVNTDNGIDVHRCGQLLFDSFQEAKHLKEEHPKLFQLYRGQDFVQPFLRKLNNHWHAISLALDDTSKRADFLKMENLLRSVRALWRMDEYVESEDCKFLKLYREFDSKRAEIQDEGMQKMSMHLEKHNFRMFVQELKYYNLHDLGEASDALVARRLDRLKNELTAKLDEVLHTIDKKARHLQKDLPLKDVSEIMDRWKMLQEAKPAVEHADGKTKESYNRFTDLSEDSKDSLKHILKVKMEAMHSEIEKALNSEHFMKADSLMCTLKNVRSTIMGLCSDKISTIIDQLEVKQEQGIETHITRYQKMKLAEYPFQPPRDFFARFESASRDRGGVVECDFGDNELKGKYSKQLGSLKAMISENIRNFITTAELRERSEDCIVLENAIRSLPDDQKEYLLNYLSDKKKEYGQDVEERERHFQEALNHWNHCLASSLLSAASQQNPALALSLERSVRKLLAKVKTQRFDILERNPCKFVVDLQLWKECDFFCELKESVSAALREDITAAFRGVQKNLRAAEIEACTSLQDLLVLSVTRTTTDSRFRNLLETHNLLCSIYNLKQQASEQAFRQLLIHVDLCCDFLQTQRCIIIDYQKKLETLMATLSPEPIEDCFDFKKAANIQQLLQENAPLYSSACSENFAGSVQELKAIHYKDFGKEYVSNFIKTTYCTADEPFTVNENHLYLNEEDRKSYEWLGKLVGSVQNLNYLTPFCDLPLDQIRKDFVAKVETRALHYWKLIQSHVGLLKSSDDKLPVKETCRKINGEYSNLEMFKIKVTVYLPKISTTIQLVEIRESLEEIVSCRARELDLYHCDDLDSYSKLLIVLKEMAETLLFMRQNITDQIIHCLDSFQKSEKGGKRAIAKLAVKLRDAKFGPAGSRIVNELEIFKGYQTYIFNAKTRAQNIDYVLRSEDLRKSQNIDLNSIDKLCKLYCEFDKEYRDVIDMSFHQSQPEDFIAQLIQKDVKNYHHPNGKVQWKECMSHMIPSLVARIFAIWTVHHSNRFLSALDEREKESYLHKPHSSQIVAIFRLFGIDNSPSLDESGPQRHLVQIKTGEGKTAVLAVACCVFALFNFEVSVACYSEYLSERDYKNVKFLFDKLHIEDKITYCTLAKLCEIEINKKVDIRGRVKEIMAESKRSILQATSSAVLGAVTQAKHLLLNGASLVGAISAPAQFPRVLLVDEVDVFFSEEFYGALYSTTCDMKSSAVASIMKEIAANPNIKMLNLEIVKKWPSYAQCCTEFEGWEFLLDSAVTRMIMDLRSFGSHEYVCCDDKIGYREQDGLVFNVSYGYKTIFAYLKEHQSGNISADSLDRNLAFLINCGSFLFAKIPNNYNLLMGVTGTLESLSQSEHNIIKNEYGISKFTYMPSVYGDHKLDFSKDRDTQVIESEFFASKLDEEIENSYSGRAVLVFFENKERIDTFQKSTAFKESRSTYKDRVHILFEDTPIEQKEDIIRCRATAMNSVTLLTRPFGRGTDFVCTDECVNKKGGVLVIQTFLSESLSEEIQIKGRTARQGENGSFRILLDAVELEKFQIGKDELVECQNKGRFYELLNRKRSDFFRDKYSSISKFVLDNMTKHDQATAFVDDLKHNKIDSVKKFLFQHNTTLDICAHKARIMILMDATGSMHHLLINTKNTLGVMFDRATEILQEKVGNALADVFEMQIVVYRNYSSPIQKLLEHSSWDSNPQHLRTFLDRITASGGSGNEAIEVGLQYANSQGRINQIILIGDAAANTEGEVAEKRKSHTTGVWAKTPFAVATNFEAEAQMLGDKGIPVQALYVTGSESVVENFAELARMTGGKSSYLDINSAAGAEELTNRITEVILASIGGTENGTELVAEYQKRFCNKAYRG